MKRLPRSITWITASCLAIAPVAIVLSFTRSWNPGLSTSVVQNPLTSSLSAEAQHAEHDSNHTDAVISVAPSGVTPSTLPSNLNDVEVVEESTSTLAAELFNCDNPQTQQAMNHCAHLDYEHADDVLNRTYNELLASVSGIRREKLVNAERAWIDYRDYTCEFERSQFEGGTMAPLIYHSCMAQLTREQTIRLETYLQEY